MFLKVHPDSCFKQATAELSNILYKTGLPPDAFRYQMSPRDRIITIELNDDNIALSTQQLEDLFIWKMKWSS